MSQETLPTEDVGAGFAFFRWHVLKFGYDEDDSVPWDVRSNHYIILQWMRGRRG